MSTHPNWQHTFADTLPELAVATEAQEFPSPRLLMLNDDLATTLGIDPAWLKSQEGLEFLTGRGGATVAMAYSGHQFGQYSPLLGDGRALLLAEVENDGHLYDIHAKGTGRTVFSRGGDGKCTITAALREYIMCEAMYGLGIPTSRALAVISTGEMIQRAPSPAFGSEDQALPPVQPGGIIVRVAQSHLRVGTFELVRHSAADLLPRLTAYSSQRHGYTGAEELLRGVVKQQADLVAQWITMGFVHGVMNTDNCTISGETIDYGPCAFLDAHNPRAVFSSIDTQGRYAFGAQPTMAAWNVSRLAESLLPELGEPDAALSLAQEIIDGFADRFSTSLAQHWLPKLGIPVDHAGACNAAESNTDVGTVGADNAVHDSAVPDKPEREAIRLLRRWQGLLASVQPDHTNTHRALRDIAAGVSTADVLPEEFASWVSDWQSYRESVGIADEHSLALMDQTNPVYIPRNHLVTEALVEADRLVRDELNRVDIELDCADPVALPGVSSLLAAVTKPYQENPSVPGSYRLPAPAELGSFTSYCGT